MTTACGAWGGCQLPRGHNMGRADVPENHGVAGPIPLSDEIRDLSVDTLAEWIKGYTFPDDGSNQLRIRPTELVADGLTVRVEELDPFPTYVGSFRIRLTVEEIT